MKPKAQFFTSLSSNHLEGKWWEISQPLAFYSASLDKTILTPRRAVTDFASVPRLPLAYLFTGNTAHWESTLHDVPGYRWGNLTRREADILFHEAAVVRSQMRTNQAGVYKVGRFARRNVMSAMVVGFGWVAYKNYPGCLDYRKAKSQKCSGVDALCIH